MTERLFLIHAVLFLQNGSDSHASVHGSLMRQLGCEDPARKLMPSWRLRSHHGPNLRHHELASSSSGPNTAVDSGSACRRTASTVTALRALETFRGQNGISKQSICQQYIVRKTSCPASGCALKKRRMLSECTGQDRAGNSRASMVPQLVFAVLLAGCGPYPSLLSTIVALQAAQVCQAGAMHAYVHR